MTTSEIDVLKQQARDNIYTVHGDIHNADCIIAFSFGYAEQNHQLKPGKSNEELADFIDRQLPAVPIIAQFEIASALKTREADLIIDQHRQKGEYLHSREIAEQALIYMRQKGWTRAVIVTHPAMIARNEAICAKIGVVTIVPDGLQTIPYDQFSVQPWTRDKDSWWQRENEVIDICVDRDWL